MIMMLKSQLVTGISVRNNTTPTCSSVTEKHQQQVAGGGLRKCSAHSLMSPLKPRLTAMNTLVAAVTQLIQARLKRVMFGGSQDAQKLSNIVLVRMTAQIEQLELQKEEQEQQNVGPL